MVELRTNTWGGGAEKPRNPADKTFGQQLGRKVAVGGDHPKLAKSTRKLLERGVGTVVPKGGKTKCVVVKLGPVLAETNKKILAGMVGKPKTEKNIRELARTLRMEYRIIYRQYGNLLKKDEKERMEDFFDKIGNWVSSGTEPFKALIDAMQWDTKGVFTRNLEELGKEIKKTRLVKKLVKVNKQNPSSRI